ncbi:MAG: hypothetical protein KKF22_09780 [Gammaproteobacteria bacterium]|nr:hypothetical protein [Gammaproteobacteria bacterium]
MRESAQANKVAKSLNSSFAWFAQRYAGWYLDDSYGFANADGQWQLKSKDAAEIRLLIVARKHYKEFVKYYPVTNIKELKQVLAEEYSDNTGVFHLIGDEADNQRQVCSFVFDAQVFELFPSALAFIPETVLLWKALQSDQAIVEVQHSSPYFLYCKGALPVSQLKQQLCPDLYSFILNNGLPEGLANKPISALSHINIVLQALAKTLISDWKTVFFKAPQTKSLQINWKQLAIVTGILGFSYMLLSSAYLSLMLAHREQQLVNLGTDVEQLLQVQESMDNTQTAFNSLGQARAEPLHSAHLWLVVLELQQNYPDLKITGLSSLGNQHTVRGTANRATDILTHLQKSAWVQTVRFDAPVRREKTQELFVIVIELKQNQQAETAGAQDVE